MSEYWVSHKKYFCKYCNIYIADDVPSRKQHESGLRHKGNVERFVRGLYKEGERRKQDLEEEKREMARVEQAAQAAYARDVGAGLVKPGSSSTSVAARPAPEPKKPVAKPSNPYADYSTAESLGYIDPDAERLKAEAERRRTQGVAGEWEMVTVGEPAAPAEQKAEAADAALGAGPSAGMKREAGTMPEEEDTRRFKLRKRTVDIGLGEIYDPGIIPVKLKKEEPAMEVVPPPAGESAQPVAEGSSTSDRPKWSARGWNRPGERDASDMQPAVNAHQAAAAVSTEPEVKAAEVKQEQLSAPAAPLPPVEAGLPAANGSSLASEVEAEDVAVKLEASVATVPVIGGSMFRKRKLPAGSRDRRT